MFGATYLKINNSLNNHIMTWIKIQINQITFQPREYYTNDEFETLRNALLRQPDANIKSNIVKLLNIFPLAGTLFYIISILFLVILIGLIITPLFFDLGITIMGIGVVPLLLMGVPFAFLGQGVSAWSYYEAKKREKDFLKKTKQLILKSKNYEIFLDNYNKLLREYKITNM